MDENQCSEKVYDATTWKSYPCQKKAKSMVEGKHYCKIHNPEYIKEKEKNAEKKYYGNECKTKDCSKQFNNFDKYCAWCGKKRI